jgi:hypothetical protein
MANKIRKLRGLAHGLHKTSIPILIVNVEREFDVVSNPSKKSREKRGPRTLTPQHASP